ncbi:MAG: zinc ABC transporter substrate-binding protein, partial [Ruegeria sp.]
AKHDEHDDHAHDHDGVDPHAWLDPANARNWVQVIAETLAQVDPENADQYRENARSAVEDLHELESDIQSDLAEVEAPRFITFHDAYQYFENRFGLTSAGTVSLGDATSPGPARLAELKSKVSDEGIDCAFSEPQYDTRLIAAAIEETDAKVLVLDPIGTTLETGPNLYPDLLRAMADRFKSCSGE